ncbi:MULTISPECIES: ubiquinone biosynthesis regulatory protein kinase UbiB [unclassified Wenzhouxiangella]|uniref:ubiquinone biosynthesis regulatory protein kinase UbiB n=1 Tax=unclassified Wenzhouxiangella TaxID=2613841 RepID=UPI000E3271B6|nr:MULTISPECIES: ubiquinone biosynthesis regulatory protein kinase UbiB [unclassified Wenzhouxiangella]RFF28753.1 ubiquinone biosynthesis regulatory protein kinase UbiB [Wenzhouxiangella sp. 15181]RFP67843.1 ubiquinone biosynthesis regulatory protein kinase UbiB [Wenzhouxiangella sp. 15190]
MISRMLRMTSIALTLARYRLDELLVALPPLRFARAVRLLPWGRRGVRDLPRGRRLRRALQELGPIYVKFGQILSTRRDLLPHDIAEELAGLQDDVPPFPAEMARAAVASELGKPVDELFAEFENEALASASIAQVHGARLEGGERVVVKIVRPGIERQIRKDLELLHALARLTRRYHPEGDRIRPDDIVSEFERVIERELDMQAEAANASLLRHNFEHSADLYIPAIHWRYTASSVLVMERVDGVPVKDIAELERRGVDLERLAQRGIRVFYTQAFRDNLFHADMHPGNILIDTTDPADPTYIALDFGIVESLPEADLHYLGENFMALFNRDYRRVAELHVEAGWLPSDTRIDELEAAIRTVGEPNFTRPLEEVSFAELIIALFSVARRFKLTLQPQLVMFQKTLLNIEGMARSLFPRLNMWDIAKPELEAILAERYGLPRTARRLARELPNWLSRSPEIPGLVHDYLERAGSGQLRTRIDSEDLEKLASELGRQNRRLPGAVFAAGLLVSGAVLAGYQVAPLWEGYSLPAGLAILGGLVLGWRTWR